MFELHETEYSSTGPDYQHRVESKIEKYGGKEGFPSMEEREITREDLTDYLFDQQAILDSGGSLKTRMVICGLCYVLPLLVLSAFPEKSLPWGKWTVLVGIGIGAVLFGIYVGLRQLYIRVATKRLRRRREALAQFVDDVLAFEPEININ